MGWNQDKLSTFKLFCLVIVLFLVYDSGFIPPTLLL